MSSDRIVIDDDLTDRRRFSPEEIEAAWQRAFAASAEHNRLHPEAPMVVVRAVMHPRDSELPES